MSWAVVLGLSAGAYLFKVLGLVVLPRVSAIRRLTPIVSLLPPALLMALVVTQTVERAGGLVLDERAAGLAVAGLLVWRRAPFLVVVVVSAAVTALLRLVW